ncbi:MAG: adenylate kinase, partial [Acidimicrobiia bacterium]
GGGSLKLLILGPPGAGKGTQAERLAAHFGIAHISTGEMFREQTGELGKLVSEIMESGDYVPDEITIQMLKQRIAKPDAVPGFVLDGFPRTQPQAESLDELLSTGGLDAVVVLEVPTEQLVTRLLQRGRADDTEAAIRTRLQVYAAQTEPLIDLYSARNLVRTVIGVGEVESITNRIIDAVSA